MQILVFIIITLAVAVAMEFVAWWEHKYIMDGFLYPPADYADPARWPPKEPGGLA